MKKKSLIICLIVVVVIASLYFLFREPFDRFNPWIKQQYVYIEIQDEPSDDNGRFKYRVKGVTESGELKRVVFTTSTRLDQGTLLKVLAKGTYTEQYTFINEDDMSSN